MNSDCMAQLDERF